MKRGREKERIVFIATFENFNRAVEKKRKGKGKRRSWWQHLLIKEHDNIQKHEKRKSIYVMAILKGHQLKLMCLMSLAIYQICWQFVNTWNLRNHYQHQPFFLFSKLWKENGKLYRGKNWPALQRGETKTLKFIFPYTEVFGISFTIDHGMFSSHHIVVLSNKSNLIRSWEEKLLMVIKVEMWNFGPTQGTQ